MQLRHVIFFCFLYTKNTLDDNVPLSNSFKLLTRQPVPACQANKVRYNNLFIAINIVIEILRMPDIVKIFV